MESNVPFDRCNLYALKLESVQAHAGKGFIRFKRIMTHQGLAGACNFIDFTSMPPGTTIGEHTHNDQEEEFYLILQGTGWMRCNGEEFLVSPGDLIRNPPGGTHRLENTGQEDLHMLVFELQVR